MTDLERIAELIRACHRCRLAESRTNPVPGAGNPHAKVMLIGEGPGYWEDQRGVPFVGRAGKLLDEYLAGIGLSRNEVFIANVVKCRPPNNRTPWKDEIEACSPFLDMQIEAVNPKVIVPLGNTAGNWIFKKYGLEWKGATQENGRVYTVSTLFGTKYIIPVFHPAAVLRRANLDPEVREAFKKITEKIRA